MIEPFAGVEVMLPADLPPNCCKGLVQRVRFLTAGLTPAFYLGAPLIMFTPTLKEISDTPDLADLLEEGRRLMRRDSASDRIRAMQDESAARSLLAAQRAMEKFQWRPKASVALINRCTCSGCGEEINLFAGFGVEMYRNSDQSTRIVMTPVLDPAWPKATHFTHTVTSACSSCLADHGFTLEAKNG